MHRDVDPAIDEEGKTDCKAVSASDSLIPSTQVSEHARTPASQSRSDIHSFAVISRARVVECVA